jgi:tetratricopeptide (TPR) repeat protein
VGPALSRLQADLKKNPYPAFEARAPISRRRSSRRAAAILEAKAAVDSDPIDALARMDALAKAFKGSKPLEAEAASALAALRKDPKTVQAVRTKEAEAQAASYMGKAEALEAKGDLVKALEWYRKAAALGETSRKADADRKIADLEPKVAGK